MRTNRRDARGRSRKDAIALLKEDHKNVKALLKRLEKTTEENTDEREELLAEVENEISVHTQIEEEIFYPAFKDAIRQKSQEHLYFEALEEHHVVEMVMPEIEDANPASEEFAAKAKVLKDLIEHHAEEEETEMFPKARKVLGAARLRELGQELADRKSELMADMEKRAA